MQTTPPNRWARHLAAGCARTVLAALAGLLAWTVLPVVLGWQPTVVLSGSMEPAIRVGDVVVTREIPAGELRPGHVLLAGDPAAPGDRLMHRYDHADDTGGLILRGDANAQADTTPVSADEIHGVGVLRIPWVGAPYVWVTEGRYVPVLITVLALGALLALSPIRERETEDDETGGDATDDEDANVADAEVTEVAEVAEVTEVTDDASSGLVEVASARQGRGVTATVATLLIIGVAAGPSIPASAAFHSITSSSASFTAATFPNADAPPAP